MSLAPFVHLRVRSAFSLLEGSLRHADLVAACRAERMPAVAVTDNTNLFGVMPFCATAAAAGIQPVIGVLLPLETGEEDGRRNGRQPAAELLPLLVQNETGYRNLCRLLSNAYLGGEEASRPRVSLDALRAAGEGLLVLTGGPFGPLGGLIRRRRTKEARALLTALREAFPGHLYVELQRHGLEEEAATEETFLEWAYEFDVPLVATNDVHFLDEEMFEAQQALLCIGAGTTMDDPERPRITLEHRFKTAAEMAALFEDLPEAVANTLVVARRCAYAAPSRPPILPHFPTAEGRDEAEELRVRAREGLERRLEAGVFGPVSTPQEREEVARPYRERLEYELEVIVQMKFPGYFLIVADFIQWAKEQGIPVGPGRGSGAGSVVAWSLRITDLDPLRFGLLFERFLNPERVSMPDFDIDFCQDRRDEVIRYVQRKYGADRVAHIITFGKLQARAVLRDVGRVLGLPFGLVDKICKLVPHNPANPPSLDQALEMEPRLREFRDRDPNVARMIDIARRLEGLPRHASTHAAGVVIGDRPLTELVPLYRDPRSDMPVTQFNMKDVEKAGLVKFDFLGLTTLTMLRLAENLVRERGVALDLEKLGLDDPATYALLGRAETAGVFQLESSGMRDALKKLRPDCFEDIVAMVSLYRPGPMDNIPRYINVKHGVEQASYLHPALAPILRETNGVIIYQEQVMEIAKQLAGYSLGGADLLRRAMGKKIKEEMDAQREVFVRGAAERGIPEDQAAAIFEQVAKFASYGFNKSHAAAYALLAYQTAYLKANHPVEFYAAVLTMEMANQDKLAAYRQEMRRQGIPLYPPDVNASAERFLVEEGEEGAGVRYALAALKGVGVQAVRAIVAERRRRGPFADLFDLAARVGARTLNRRLLEALVRAGAFDRLEPNRRRLFESVEAALRYAQAWAASERDRQASLFGGEVIRPRRPELAAIEDWNQLERLQEEASVVGFYLSAHPLDAYASELERLRVVPAAALFEEPAAYEGRRLRLAGVVIGKQERTGGRSRYAFVQLSDASAQYEVTVFSELLSTARELLEGRAPLLLEADARVDGGEVKLVAQRILPLDHKAGEGGTLELRIADAAALAALARLLEGEARGGLRLRLLLPTAEGHEVAIELPSDRLLPWPARTDVARLPGVVAVSEVSRRPRAEGTNGGPRPP